MSAKSDADLVRKINQSVSSGEPFDTRLDTDERVLARVTDGIYRQPGSALRELIANAYDADAKSVSITTDAPRFKGVEVRDNGNGMTPEVLANLVLHIGGSAKRTQRGREIGIASPDDPTRSIGGRRQPFQGLCHVGPSDPLPTLWDPSVVESRRVLSIVSDFVH